MGIPAGHPRLYCSICKELKHAKCQYLNKLEARDISNNTSMQWSCYDCKCPRYVKKFTKQKKVSLLLLNDFPKAFDMVEQDNLLRKLICYGIRGNAHT